MFEIEGCRDFYRMLVADFDDFIDQSASGRRAIHCAISAFHLYEWVWGDLIKPDMQLQAALGVNSCREFLRWIEQKSPWFSTVQKLANGGKHFIRNPNFHARKMSGFGRGPYGMGPYGSEYLLLDLGENAGEHRWKPAAYILEVVVRFWRDFFRTYQPSLNLPHSKHHVD